MNWYICQNTHHPKGGLEKANRLTGWTFESTTGKRILLNWGHKPKECMRYNIHYRQTVDKNTRMRYIIYYRQNVDNTLAWQETPGIPKYIIGDLPKTWIGFHFQNTHHPKRKLVKGWLFDSTKNTNLAQLGKINKGFQLKSAWDILFITGRPWTIYSKGKDTRDTEVYNRWLTKKRDNRYQASG